MLDIIKSGRRYDKDYEFTGAEGNLMPIYGGIPCGELGYLDDNIEGYVEIPESLIGTGS